MNNKKTDLPKEVANYYAEKLAEHGETLLGVDLNVELSQTIHFDKLHKVINLTHALFSLNDLGCGYGGLLDYLQGKHPSYTYLGVNVAKEMIVAANQRNKSVHQARFITSPKPDQHAEWFDYLKSTINMLNSTSTHGFSFNCLTSY